MVWTKTHKLPDGRVFPNIGFGTYLIPPTETTESVLNALQVGYRLIDTAACYINEEETADAIAQFIDSSSGKVDRKDVIYTSKLWEPDYGYEGAKRGVEESLRNAKVIDYIDLYLIHSPKGGKETRIQTWRALQEYVDKGKIKAIGVSNWSDKHLKELLEWEGLTVRPVVNQIELNPWFQQNTIVEFCQKENIIVEAYSPLTLGRRLDHPQVTALAKKYNVTPGQVLLRWAIDRGTVPIPKTLRKERMIENFSSLDFKFTDEDLKNLGDPTERYVTVPEWDPTIWE